MQLIVLNSNDAILAWFFTNNGHDPLELMGLESGAEDGQVLDVNHEPPNRWQSFFNRDVWDYLEAAQYATPEMQEPEVKEWIDHEEWCQAELKGATRAPSGAGVITVHDSVVSIETEPGHKSRQDR